METDSGIAAPATVARILIVDDFQPFRVELKSYLQHRLECLLVGEAADGVEAVKAAGDLHPDIILLDIGLPGMNGFDAARKIAGCSPASRVIFVTQDTSASVAEAALKCYGSGYVVKTDVGRELLTAVNTVLKGEKYIPRRFAHCEWVKELNAVAPDITTVEVPLFVLANAGLASARAQSAKHREVMDDAERLLTRLNRCEDLKD